MKAAIPTSMVVDTTWEVKQNFDDLSAVLTDPQGYTKPVRRDFFKVNTVQHFTALDVSECRKLADKLHATWKSQLKGSKENPHCLQELKKKQVEKNRQRRTAAPKQKATVRLRAKVSLPAK